MLIVTERHTKADLELWKDYEEIDELKINSYLDILEENAFRAMAVFSKNKNCYIGISWGKDSVVTADLALRNGLNFPLVHLNCIPSHNPGCDLVRDSFLKIYSTAQYYEIICDYRNVYALNLPDYLQDKETDKIWYQAWDKVGKEIAPCHISGVRGEESTVRQIRMRRWGCNTERTCAPIGYWKNQQVFSYLFKYDLPVHPNYGMLGGGRWERDRIRVAEIGDIHGNGGGRAEWEREYYPDILAKIKK